MDISTKCILAYATESFSNNITYREKFWMSKSKVSSAENAP